jgi:hypothetical protein
MSDFKRNQRVDKVRRKTKLCMQNNETLGVIKKSSPGVVPWNSLLLPLKERSLANLHNALITTTYFMPPCTRIPQNKDKPAAA